MGVDYVVPMVFTDDPEWQSSYVKSGLPDLSSPRNAVRYRSWGTEEQLVRCILRFMPWIRKIHILLSGQGQVREWMSKYDKVNVVFHADFIPRRFLPTFSSCTIEMFIPFIQGLSERFIYGNDDMYPISPLSEEDFFVDGLPCQIMAEKPLPPYPNIFHMKCLNQQNMVGRNFGKRYTDTLLRCGHSLSPMLLSECKKVRKCFCKEIEDNITPQRTEKSYNQYLYVLWQHFTGRYHMHVPYRMLTSVRRPVGEVHDIILISDADVVCVNDNEVCADITEYASAVRDAIEKRLAV